MSNYSGIALEIQQLIKEALEELVIAVAEEINLEHPADQNHGDYSCNIALTAFAQLKNKKFKNPRELATAIVEKISSPIVSKIEVAGPGFINFYLSHDWLIENMLETLHATSVRNKNLSGQKIMVEFTDPNPFKEFHIGHLYSNTVGESIARVFESRGAEVKRADYFGDVGMHAAKSIWGLREKLRTDPGLEIKEALNNLGKKPINQRVKFLGQAYALGATAFKDDEKAQEEIKEINFLTFLAGQERLVEEESWQPQVDYKKHIKNPKFDYEEIKLLFITGRQWSLDYFDSIYERVGMGFDYYFPESAVGEYGVKIVKNGLEKGIFEKSDGAIIFPGKEHGLHDRVFINSLGLPTYEAKELGLAPEKHRQYPYDKSLIITGNEINEYFKVLLKALSKTHPELEAKTTHMGHGMVRLPEGKMSSRTGKIITGEWLLDEAKKRVLDVFEASDKELNEKERNEIAEKIGQAAVKYAFLKSNIGDDIAFSFDESLSFAGNSGPYLQYTYVRCFSVLQKAKLDINKPFDTLIDLKSYKSQNLNNEEIDILRNLYKYFEVVELAAREYAPHHICTYLYSLAQKYNKFYNHHKIIENSKSPAPNSKFRLALTLATAKILKEALNLLGIQVVEKM
ncbi:MAG: arginine--tRNA ligase [Patescibacteria group bacterium]